MAKVAIYCRLSEEDRDKRCEKDDSESIQNQKVMLCQYVLEHGWDVYDIYSDDDYVLAEYDESNTNSIHLYDKIITQGKDLKDGKVYTWWRACKIVHR